MLICYFLGKMKHTGYGVPQNKEDGLKLLKKAGLRITPKRQPSERKWNRTFGLRLAAVRPFG
jgi:hypothetical protein